MFSEARGSREAARGAVEGHTERRTLDRIYAVGRAGGYVIQVENRDRVQELLRAQGVATGIHYPIPIHFQEACAHLGYRRGAFPFTERGAGRILSLPMDAEMTGLQIEYVTSALHQAVTQSLGI